MIVYTFDYESGAFTGIQLLGPHDLSPLEHDVMLIPGNATSIAPPRCGKKLWPFWRNGYWQVMEEIEPPKPGYWAEWEDLISL